MSFYARLQHCLTRVFLPCLMLLSAAAHAQTTHRVPQDFPTIQAAINNSSDGDTIAVSPGTYTENLLLTGKALHLVSTAGASVTTLDGGFNGPVLTISSVPSMGTSLSGFTVQHGLATGSSSSAAGVLLVQSGAVLSNNSFLHNSGDNIGVSYGTVSVLNNTISTAPSDEGSGNNCDGGDGVSVVGTTPVNDSNGQPVPSTITSNTIFGDSTLCSGTAVTLATSGLLSPHLIANNILRNSAVGLNLATDAGAGGGAIVRQNLIYDNANGAISLTGPTSHPSTDPPIVLFLNNTVVNNLNQPATSPLTEISLTGTAAHTAFINNILVGTTSNPVLTCDTGNPTYNDTPLILDHTDFYNTTRAQGGLIAGDCTTGVSNQLANNGNLSTDPLLNNSTDLHLSTNSPAIDAGTNSAPTLTVADLDGNPRFIDATNLGFATVDLGAYEHSGAADSGVTSLLFSSSAYSTPPANITLTAVSTALDGSHSQGTVTFSQQGATLSTVHTDATGTANLNVPLTTPGVVAFTASFAPDASVSVAPTISPVLYVDVTTGSAAATSTLTLSANPTSVTTAQSTTVTIQLGTANDGGVIPPGPVTLSDNGAILATLQPSSTTGVATYTLANPASGTHSMVASYAGNSSFTSATATTTVTVAALLPSTLSITATSASGFAGQPLVLSIQLGSLTTTGATGPVPPGAVALYSSNAGFLTTLQPDSSGNVTYTIGDPPAGNTTYTVRYAGNTVYAPSSASTGASLTPVVPTTAMLTAAPSPAVLGSTVTLTATVTGTSSGSQPAGSVRFTDGVSILGTASLGSTGDATLSLNTLTLGTHALHAAFLPAAGYAGSSASASESIIGIGTSTSLSSALNPAGPADVVAYTATVSATSGSTAPTGTISITDGATLLASGTLAAISTTTSTVTLSASDSALGTRSLVATYTPGPGFTGSTASLIETIVTPPIPSITLAVTPNPASITAPITLGVAPANAPVGATLNVLDGATTIASASAIASQISTLPAGALNVGVHTLTAVLRDAHGNLLATSAATAERVTGLTSALTLTVSPAASALVGSTVTLNAALTSAGLVSHTPSGPITFRDGALVLGSVPIDMTGHASITTSTLTAGSHTLTASWSGDDLLSAATAPSIAEQILVNPTTTSISVSSLGTAAFAAVTFAAQVTSSAPVPLNTAVCTPACSPITVTFFNGQSALGTAPIDATGHASITLHPESGTLAVSAAFSGSPLFSPSTSPSLADAIVIAPTVLTLAGSPNPLYQHGSVTLGVALSASTTPPAAALAGAPITLLDGSNPIGTITSPAGTLVYAPSTTGIHTLTATFAGTADLAPSTAILVITVLPSDFAVTVADSALTIQTEHHAPTTVTVTMTGDLTDTIDLSCDNPPNLVSCTFATSAMPLSASNSPTQTTQLIVDTDFIQRWASLRRPSNLGSTDDRGSGMFSNLATALALALPSSGLFLYRKSRRAESQANSAPNRSRQWPNLLAMLLLTVCTFGLIACGSTEPGHTPPGTYPLTVTAHARAHSYVHTATITLTITP